jgi:hypothetical protein
MELVERISSACLCRDLLRYASAIYSGALEVTPARPLAI